jgi:hypothetical protein
MSTMDICGSAATAPLMRLARLANSLLRLLAKRSLLFGSVDGAGVMVPG